MPGPRPADVREQYQACLLDMVDDGVVGTDEGFRITQWNLGAERLYGYTAQQVMGSPASDVATFAGDDQRERLERDLREHGRARAELTAMRQDGTPVEVEIVVTAVRDDAGTLRGYLGIHRDVTERRRAARRLEQLSALVANAPDFIGFADLDGRAVFVNDAGLRLLGLRDGAVAEGRDVVGFAAEHDRARVRDDVLPGVMRDGHRTDLLDLHDVTGGAPVPVSSHAFRVDDPVTGRPMGIATIARDRRMELRAQALLRASEGRSGAILESVADPLLGLDGDLRLTFLNDGAFRLIARLHAPGTRPATFIGAHALTVLPAELGTPLEHAVATARAERRPVDAGRHRDELGNWWQIRVHPAAGGGVSVLLRDVSGWRAAEDDSARRSEQQALVARLGARSARAEDLGPFLDDAVRRIGRAVGATIAVVAELASAGDGLVVRAGAGLERGDAMVVGTTDPTDLFGRALAGGAAVVADDVLTDERFDVAPALAAHRPAAGAVVPIAGHDETHAALAVFSHAAHHLAPPDVDFLEAAAHVLGAAIERSRTTPRLEQARDAERRRIARALHDEALQDVRYALARAEDPPEGAPRDDVLVEALTRIGRELRSAVYDLRPADDERSLDDLLAELAERHRRMAPDLHIDLDLDLGELPERLPRRTRGELVRILGEALTNVRRHAGAERVEIRAWATARALWCDVADDGRGVCARATPGNGIAGMRERAEQLGGHVDLQAPGAGGTRVRVRLPLSSPGEVGAPIRVLLVEDHVAVREAIAAAFRSEPDFEVVGEAGTLAEARRMLGEVDVALVDLGLPDGDGSDLIGVLREAEPGAHAIVLSAGLDRSVVARAVERGAAGALSKADRLPDVIDAVRRVRAGETLLPLDEVVELLRFAGRERERELLDRQAIHSLTSRELEILQLIAEGCDSRNAASRLHISVRTQRNHVANILGKLGVHSQLQALIFAMRYQLVELRSPGW
jgi:PAS domain S-box-containing protein